MEKDPSRYALVSIIIQVTLFTLSAMCGDDRARRHEVLGEKEEESR